MGSITGCEGGQMEGEKGPKSSAFVEIIGWTQSVFPSLLAAAIIHGLN
jgi:hypothetical protein